jgi:hypothetical protein
MKPLHSKILRFVVILAVLVVAAALIISRVRKEEVGRTEEQLISTIVELSVAQKMFLHSPESYDSAREEILQRNGFDHQEFEALEETYEDDPERWVRVWQGVVKRLEELQQERGRQPLGTKKRPEREKTVQP